MSEDPQSDIIQRLHFALHYNNEDWQDALFADAAREIERLRGICDAYEQAGPWRTP